MRLPKSTKLIRPCPYPGIVLVTQDWGDFAKLAKKLLDRDEEQHGKAGRFVSGPSKLHPFTYLVFWTGYAQLAHEMAHIVFAIFDLVGIQDASCGNEEPFCYLLSQLITDTLE